MPQVPPELQELDTQVTRTTTVIGSATTLIRGIAARIDAAKTDPAKLTELANSLRTNADELAAAVSENTPSAEESQA